MHLTIVMNVGAIQEMLDVDCMCLCKMAWYYNTIGAW
jgi:hypothetical protein